MRWQGRRQSEHVDDRRRAPAMVRVGGGIGILGFILLLILTGGDIGKVLNFMAQQQPAQVGVEQPDQELTPEQEARKEFSAVVLADTEEVWTDILPRSEGVDYREPKLVLFHGAVQSGCGFAQAQVGPFYCPVDQSVYLDTGFFDELADRFGAPGDFAQAYVIAHEVGHHVQNLLGLTDQVHAQKARLSEGDYNALSVRLELQADYLAGVWAHHAQKRFNILEPGDIEEALTAAQAIGDDRLQKQAQGYVVPDSFTHGTSAQRMKWFRKGLETGDAAGMNQLFELPDNQL
ncbi:MAG: zinc metallopeptidase [Planctomycetaceae bacterium]|nr:zinc metallopeptidase [Planctomycetaceae bacterium]